MSWSRKRLLLAASLIGLTLAVFSPVRHYDFVDYDDPVYVTRNPHLDAGLSSEGLRWAFLEPFFNNWIPLTSVSFLVDHALFAPGPAGHHVMNVALHALGVALLFWVLSSATGALGRSAFVAGVFAWHPLHVESVAWIAERKDVLSGVFWMLTLGAWVSYVRQVGRLRYALVLLALAAGLLSKSVCVTLPAVLLLFDFWPLQRLGPGGDGHLFDPRRLRRALLDKLPMLPLIAAVAVVTYVVQRDTGAMSTLEHVPLGARIENALVSYLAYVKDASWPSDLAVFYPRPETSLPVWQWGGAACVLVATTLGALIAAPHRPWLTVGWLWWVGTLVPMIGLVQVGLQARADRYTYIPLIGLSIAVTWEAWAWLERSQATRRLGVVLAVGVLAALAVATSRQLPHWHDTVALFERARAATDDNYLALNMLGVRRLQEGDAPGALALLSEAVRIQPRWGEARGNLADVQLALGRRDDAMRGYEAAVALNPDHVGLRERFGKALVEVGRSDEALRQYAAALQRDDGSEAARLHALSGAAWAMQGRTDQAIQAYERALALDPAFSVARTNLALLRLGSGDPAAGVKQLEAVLAAGGEGPELHAGLAEGLARLGREREAADHYQAALRARPGWPQAANNLAWLLATARDRALRDPTEALRLAESAAAASGRRDPGVLDTLATAQAAAGRFTEAVATVDAALALASASGQSELAAQLQERRARFAGGLVWEEPAPAP